MTGAQVRKTVAAGIAGVCAIAGEAVTIGLASGREAQYIQLAITSLTAVAGALAVFQVPNGATLTERVAALEQVAKPVIVATEPLVRQIETDLHAGKSGPLGKWPTQTPPVVAPAVQEVPPA